MNPVFQTKLHDPPRENGNCLAAAVASILEIDIEQVPAFEDMLSTVWFGWMVCWLDGRGLTCDYLEPEEFERVNEGEIVVAGGDSPRSGPTLQSSFTHVVLQRDGLTIHDPHPSGDGLVGDPTGLYLIRRKP